MHNKAALCTTRPRCAQQVRVAHNRAAQRTTGPCCAQHDRAVHNRARAVNSRKLRIVTVIKIASWARTRPQTRISVVKSCPAWIRALRGVCAALRSLNEALPELAPRMDWQGLQAWGAYIIRALRGICAALRSLARARTARELVGTSGLGACRIRTPCVASAQP